MPRTQMPLLAVVSLHDAARTAIASLQGHGRIAGQFLAQLSKMDALLHAVRAFENASVPHIEGSIDPDRDVATMNLELAFSDLAIIESASYMAFTVRGFADKFSSTQHLGMRTCCRLQQYPPQQNAY